MAKKKSEGKAVSDDAAKPDGGTATATEMLFESADFRVIPAGVKQVLLKVADVGDAQSVSIGVAVFEQLTATSPWIVLSKQEIDNLASTPEQSFLAIAPKTGAKYALTFVGEMHALTLSGDPLSLTLAITADGVGSAIEDFNGKQTVKNRFCPVRGRALLQA